MCDRNIKSFGLTDKGEDVSVITLEHAGCSCQILTYGATIRSLCVPDKSGKLVDVVLGYDTLKEYEQNDGYLGATVGRFANRIAHGQFSLSGKSYTLVQNNGYNHLHGGVVGFSHRVWDIVDCSNTEVTLSLTSSDGEEGYPGTLHVRVTFSLKENALSLHYCAVSDTDTICSLTNHSYFNLAGHSGGSVENHEICIRAHSYTPTAVDAIPLGVVSPVANTPMDLSRYTRVGDNLNNGFPQIAQARGFDHNFVVDEEPGFLRPAAAVRCLSTGITMQVETTMPGVQFYTANYLEDGRRGKNGCSYGPRHGFCLETQHFPDAPNQKNFPSPLLRAGNVYDHTTVFAFNYM